MIGGQTPCRMHDNEPVADTPPRVSLLLSENVHMFLLTRRVLLNIGLRYRKRLQAFTSGLMIGVLVLRCSAWSPASEVHSSRHFSCGTWWPTLGQSSCCCWLACSRVPPPTS